MINVVVAFGCSNTYGSETIKVRDTRNPNNVFNAFPFLISQKINGEINHKNCARVGASNFEIAMRVVNYVLEIQKQKDETPFIVIGWSGDDRFPLWVKNEFNTLRPNAKQHSFDKADIADIAFTGFCFRNFFFDTCLNTFLNAFVKLGTSLLLDRYKIPYITVPTILYKNHPLYDLLDKSKNVLCYDHNDNLVFDFYNFKEPSCTVSHLTKCQQAKFAEWLYNYMIENKTLPENFSHE
jgi:hypothetical protein